MPNLSFSDLSLSLLLHPGRKNNDITGSLKLTLTITSAGDTKVDVEIELKAGMKGTKAGLLFRSTEPSSGVIEPFEITLSKPHGPVVTWTFMEGLLLSKDSQGRVFAASDKVNVGDKQRQFSAIPLGGENPPLAVLDVNSNSVPVGQLVPAPLLPSVYGLFLAKGGGLAFVTETNGQIDWSFAGRVFSGDRFTFGKVNSPSSGVVDHGYAGVSNRSLRPTDDEENWEATTRGTGFTRLTLSDAEPEPDASGLPFPNGAFAMIITGAEAKKRDVQHSGMLWLSGSGSKPVVSIQSGKNLPVPVPVVYTSGRPNVGVIRGFSIQIGTETWSFGAINVVHTADGSTYLYAFQLTIGADGSSMFCLPFPGSFFSGTFDVNRRRQGGVKGNAVGTLQVNADGTGSFLPVGSTSGQQIYAVGQEIIWGPETELSTGFPFVVDVNVSVDGIALVVGFLGVTKLPKRVDFDVEETWEATTRGGGPITCEDVPEPSQADADSAGPEADSDITSGD